MLSARLLTMLFGSSFIFAGLLGFIPNPFVSPDGLFAVNAAHNIVHILSGIAFIIGGILGYSRLTLLSIGGAYVLVTVAGFLTTGDTLLGFIHINYADRWLHAGLSVAILGAGFLSDDPLETANHSARTTG